MDGCETGLQDKVGNMSVPGLSVTCPHTPLSEPEQGSAGDNGVTELSEKVPVYNAENPSVAVLSESETDEQVIRKFRKEVDEMVLRLEVKPSGKLLRTMKKFDDKLEAAVTRMAILGCIDEEEMSECADEPEDDLGLSLADKSEKMYEIGSSSKNVESTDLEFLPDGLVMFYHLSW